MKLKALSPALPALMALLAVAGAASVVAGVYLLLGLAAALITGGVVSTAAGMLVDVG